ncbi:MAG: hypothetical protein PVH40_06960 [Gemmatimonadales bacterium]|jgi:hypothetical protein
MFLPSRERKGPDRYYTAKLTLLIAGVALLLVGVRLDNGWLANAAIGVLAVAVLLRLLPQRQAQSDLDQATRKTNGSSDQPPSSDPES